MVNQRENSKPRKDYQEVRQEAEKDILNELGSEALNDLEAAELDALKTTLGMEEVELNQAVIDTVAVDDDNLDAEDDVAGDEDEEQDIVDNRPQELTESYGTGLQGKPSDRAGRYSRRTDPQFFNQPDPMLTGGDIDANYEQAAVVGDESVGGTVATPDQDVVEELAAAAGVQLDDRSYVRVNEMLEQRDDQRWELDPKSSEDYENRRDK